MNVSIRARLLVSATLVLVAFFGITGVALERGFHNSVETAVHERLQAQVYALLTAADLSPANRLFLPNQLPEPRLSAPDSGLVADVTDAGGNVIWKSRSMIGIRLPARTPISVAGNWEFNQLNSLAGRRFLVTSFVASFAGNNKELHRFRFRVAEDYRFAEQQIGQFRRSLWTWLGVVGVMLLAVQGSILRWSLAPLGKAENEIAEIEAGQRKQLSKDYPRELQELTQRLNLLVENSDKHLQRYRDSLGNLAHSLKTPLAVLKNAADTSASTEELRQTADEQIRRMIEIVNHQLQRAATAGRTVMVGEFAVADPINKLASALKKVYAGKSVEFSFIDNQKTHFAGDEGDFMELVGNLMDNAFKWCRKQVRVSVTSLAGDDETKRIQIIVDDDGPGIPEKQRNLILQRGKQANPDSDGQGLGLDMVLETVSIYNGSLKLLENDWGGSRIEIIL
ncbi:MAG: ATP-binding protein [Acidiferrobacterales bacterium]